MSEWWTYGLSDFLMFSPQAYWRLVARYNTAWWPAQVLGVAGTLALPALLRLRSPAAPRATLGLLALAWAWVAWAFFRHRYGEIFLAAPWLAGAWGVQAALLLVAALLPAGEARGTAFPAFGWCAGGLALAAPLLAPLAGRPWSQAEVPGFMPDPTALLTLAVLAVLPAQATWLRIALAVVPVLSLLLGAATRWLLAQ
jgi:hypothetical protein